MVTRVPGPLPFSTDQFKTPVSVPDTTVTADDFIKHVSKLDGEIAGLSTASRQYSDLSDDSGNQYIDIVMEGGGTLGVALLGYLYVLEKAGLRFLGIGGTSAGAVTATLLAVADRPSGSRTQRLLGALANMPMKEFIDGKSDGDTDAVHAIYSWLDRKSGLRKLWTGAQVIDNLKQICALNRGQVFKEWVQSELKTMNRIRPDTPITVAQLRQMMSDIPPLKMHAEVREDELSRSTLSSIRYAEDGSRHLPIDPSRNRFVVIAADIATETRVEFPAMAGYFWPDPDNLDIADFVRMSMSIPGFFAPVRVPSLPVTEALRDAWGQLKWPPASYVGDFLPAEHCFVDGGILSNFPIKVFHSKSGIPLCPTFGVKLQFDEHKNKIDDVFDLLAGCFNSARHALDLEFIRDNPEYDYLVAHIDTKDVRWLDFAMSRETKLRLFEMGAHAAIDFLKRFDWHQYKQYRRALFAASSALHEAPNPPH
jgi:NTE family protein